ncbi:unnamed protein product [Arctogadus glacialis]
MLLTQKLIPITHHAETRASSRHDNDSPFKAKAPSPSLPVKVSKSLNRERSKKTIQPPASSRMLGRERDFTLESKLKTVSTFESISGR